MSGPAGAGRASRRSTIISSIADRAADGVAKPFIAKPASLAHHDRLLRPLPAALPGIPALALSACATPLPPVDVTRFHHPPVPGSAPGPPFGLDPRAPPPTPHAQ